MDLGATICTPQKARLRALPLVGRLPRAAARAARRAAAQGAEEGAADALRHRLRRAARKTARSCCAAVRRRGLLGGMSEVPGSDWAEAGAVAAIRRFAADWSALATPVATPSRISRCGFRIERADVGLDTPAPPGHWWATALARRSAAERHEKGHRSRLSGRDETARSRRERHPPYRPRRRQGAGPLRSASRLPSTSSPTTRSARRSSRSLPARLEHRAGSRPHLGGGRGGGDRPPSRQGRPDPRLPRALAHAWSRTTIRRASRSCARFSTRGHDVTLLTNFAADTFREAQAALSLPEGEPRRHRLRRHQG